jgi:hypothetical protein
MQKNLHGYTTVSFVEGHGKSNLSITYHSSALSSVVCELKQAGPLKSGIFLLVLVHQRCDDAGIFCHTLNGNQLVKLRGCLPSFI